MYNTRGVREKFFAFYHILNKNLVKPDMSVQLFIEFIKTNKCFKFILRGLKNPEIETDMNAHLFNGILSLFGERAFALKAFA